MTYLKAIPEIQKYMVNIFYWCIHLNVIRKKLNVILALLMLIACKQCFSILDKLRKYIFGKVLLKYDFIHLFPSCQNELLQTNWNFKSFLPKWIITKKQIFSFLLKHQIAFNFKYLGNWTIFSIFQSMTYLKPLPLK